MDSDGELCEKARLYEALYNVMMGHFYAHDFDACDRLAGSLLLNADLPVIIRARCYMILGTAGYDPSGAHSNFLYYARAAVRLLEDARAQGVVIRDATIDEANELLAKAEADHAAHTAAGLYEDTQEEAVAEGEGAAEGEGPAEGPETMAEDIGGPSATATTTTEAATALAGGTAAERFQQSDLTSGERQDERMEYHRQRAAQTTKRVRRVRTGDTEEDAQLEEFDETSGHWRSRGPILDGEAVDFLN